VRFRRSIAAALAGLATVAVGAGIHAEAQRASKDAPPKDSLRALAAPIGLRVGVAVNPTGLQSPDYRRIAAREYSSVTPENEMKWETLEPTRGQYDFAPAERILRFAERHDQLVRGHVLLWHNQLPSWLRSGVADGSIDNAELRRILRRHIIRTVGHFKGRVWQWDVANEFFTDTDPSRINPDNFWVSHLGEGIIAEAFRWAHRADPDALLFYNDYNIGGEDISNAKADAVYAWAQRVLAQGVPIDGIGDQGHLDTQYPFPDALTSNLRRYAGLGLKVAITEADVRTFVNNAAEQIPTDHLATLAQPYEFSQMMKACLSVRACISFTVWGVGDAYSWVPGFFQGQGYALLHDVNLRPKPAYNAVRQDLALANGAPRRPATETVR
jgi:endo-1,4-beta-xylanase